jgi:hypothetical protein
MASVMPLRYPIPSPRAQPPIAQPKTISGRQFSLPLLGDGRQGYKARKQWGDRAHFRLHPAPGRQYQRHNLNERTFAASHYLP